MRPINKSTLTITRTDTRTTKQIENFRKLFKKKLCLIENFSNEIFLMKSITN
jgi:hypothetical protein